MAVTDRSVTASCSFCLKSTDDVAKLVAGPARSSGPSYVAARNVRRSGTDRVAGHDSNGDATGLARIDEVGETIEFVEAKNESLDRLLAPTGPPVT